MSTIIGISGKARAGKDTAFIYFSYRQFVRMSFADPLKELCRKMFKLSTEQTDGKLKEIVDPRYNMTPRAILIKVGNDMRAIMPDVWVQLLIEKIKQLPSNSRIIITDVRYRNEAEALKSIGGYIARLERHPSRDNMVSEETKASLSETDLDNYPAFNFVLPAMSNETPQDLEKWVTTVLEQIKCF